MEVLFERVAGLDIGKGSVTVCVRTPGAGGRRRGETRTFKTMTRSLVVMRDWLVECGVTIAAMEGRPGRTRLSLAGGSPRATSGARQGCLSGRAASGEQWGR